MNYALATGSHSYMDTMVGSYIGYHAKLGRAITIRRRVTTLERLLSYRFYPHFHPYVQALITQLIEKTLDGLQAVDTEYIPASDGTLPVLPDSIRVTVFDDLDLTLSGGRTLKVLAGTRVILPHKTPVKLPDGSNVTLPGSMVVTQPRGLRFYPAAGSPKTIAYGDPLILRGSAQVKLPQGELVTLPTNTKVVLLECQPRPKLFDKIFTPQQYDPSNLVERPYPVEDLDFTSSGAYSVYNWELFYHAPITIAIHLSKNQRFAEAQRWFHYIFDPTDDSDGPTPERFWKVKPFQYTDVKFIGDILFNLSSGGDPELRQDTINSINAWKNAPFRPHVVARHRQTAYMYKAVMAYLDNLIAWGDSLFRQDTRESIGEAMQLYVLAANILGSRPQAVPRRGSVRPQTYANISKDLDEFGNVLRDLEVEIPFDLVPIPNEATDFDRFSTARSLGRALYFCVPHNDRLLDYWDTVADRLFKIRNSLNIQGIFRQLPLFEPPIDPGMLAKAAAAGLDIAAVVSGANQPLPLVRFQFLVQKAAEICQEVKSLGGSLLSAMEKEDNEALAILRAKHERVVLEMAEAVRYSQWQEAIKAREGLEVSLVNAIQRYTYYERLLNVKAEDIESNIPEFEPLDVAGLEKKKFRSTEPQLEPREITVDIAEDLGASGGKIMSSHEAEELEKQGLARDIQEVIRAAKLTAQGIGLLPDFVVDLHYWGLGGNTEVGGGEKLADVASFAGEVALAIADRYNYEAGRAAKIGSYARREQEWAFQSNVIAGEITQTYKQLRAAQIREAMAEREWKNHKKQIEHAEEIERFLTEEKKGKKTNKDFYTWMKREAKGLHGQCFQFAFDVAKKAERALQHELGNPKLSYLRFGYLAGKEGLLAGEKLYLDIKRMEMAYHDLNQREYELTRHVSLLQVNPLALLQLRATGRCTVALGEGLFDMDCPGHYFRRIKSVALSIPCVTGPYASVNCTLTLLKSSIRKSQSLGDGYARENSEDPRFSDHFGSLQSVVTSSGQNDSGLFETNLRDERYLPFEGSGVISEWQLQLPADPSKKGLRQFDYDTITDVIFHLRYTAREGGVPLRDGAVSCLKTRTEEANAAGSVRLFSVRHEFPTAWAKFQSQPASANRFELTVHLRPEHYPFWSRECLNSVKRVDVLARSSEDPAPASLEVADKVDDLPVEAKKETLTKDDAMGNLLIGTFTGGATGIALPANPVCEIKLFLAEKTVEDLWIVVTWSSET